MKLRFMSDLHLEFADFEVPALEGDSDAVLVLAGDVCSASERSQGRFMTFMANVGRQFKSVVYVPGNHEYYNGSFSETWQHIKDNLFGLNIHCLENDRVDIDEFTFLGSALWTGFKGADKKAMEAAKTYMNDYHMIAKSYGEGSLDPKDTLKAHLNSIGYLFGMLTSDELEERRTVVVTHHAPSPQSVAERFRDGPNAFLNPSYYTNLESSIEALKGRAPELWIHGHMHNTFDYLVGKTQVRTNPRGYDQGWGPENDDFDPELVMEL